MLDRPFSDVCSTVSCWALLFSVILPSMQLMGLEVTTITAAAAVSPSSIKSPSTTSSSSSSTSSSASTTSYAFTVYLDPSSSHSLELYSTFSISLFAHPDPAVKVPSQHDAPPEENETKEQTTSTKKRVHVIHAVPQHIKRGQQQLRTRTIWIETEAEQDRPPTSKENKSKHIDNPVVVARMDPEPGKRHHRYSRHATEAIQQFYDNGRFDPSLLDEAHFNEKSEERGLRRTEQQPKIALEEDPWKRDNYRRRHSRQELESLSSSNKGDNAAVSSPSSSSASATTRREVMISRRQIWKGYASVVVGTTGTTQKGVTHHNGSESSKTLHDILSGPLITIPFLATTLPPVPFQWIALVPCTLQNTLDRQSISQLSAYAVILHATLESDCSGMLESSYPEPSPMILSMDREPAEQLLYSLDDLTPEITPMARLSKVALKPRKTSLKPARIVFEAEETLTTTVLVNDATHTLQRQQDSTEGFKTLDKDGNVDNKDASDEYRGSFSPFPRQRFSQEKTRQVVISLPEIASIVDSLKTGAAMQARRVLVNLGLETSQRRTQVVKIQDIADKEAYRDRPHDKTRPQRPQPEEPATLVATTFRALSSSLFMKQEIRNFKNRLENLDSEDDNFLDKGYDSYDDHLQTLAAEPSRMLKAVEAQTETELEGGGKASRHPKARARPNRQMARMQSNSAAQVLEDVSSLVLLKDSIYQQYLHHHLHGSHLQHQSPHVTDFLESKGVVSTNISGKIAVVLMSTVCGVGVGMFGALLVVVALKARLLASRRASNGSNNENQATTAQQQQVQQGREQGHKKVLSKSTLDSFGIQTVVKTGEGTMIVASSRSASCCGRQCHHHRSNAKKKKVAKREKSPEMTQLTSQSSDLGYSRRLTYAEDIIDMESGLEDQEVRQEASLQRQQRRVRIMSIQVDLGTMTSNVEEDDQGGDEHVDIHTGYQVDYNGLQDYGDEDENENEGLDAAATTELDRIATSLMATSRHGSYRRVSYSRQGQRNSDWHGSSGFFSSSSLSSSTSTLHSSLLTNGSMSTLADSYSEASSSSLSLSISLSLSNDRRGDKPLGCMTAGEEDCTGESGTEDIFEMDDRGADDVEEEEEGETSLPFANANAQTMCAVCLAEYELGDQVRTLPCFHQYHQTCIDPWLLEVAALCPICKRDLLQSPTAPPSCP